MHLKRLVPVFLFAMAALLLTLGATALAQPIDKADSDRSPDELWTFQGMVFNGNVGDTGDPISGVTVELYGSNDYGVLGDPLDDTTTDGAGWYGFEYQDRNEIYEYYNIQEIDPLFHASIGAATVSGTVISKNWIQISAATTDRTFTGNRFWDRIPLLQGKVFEGPVLDESKPKEGVTVTLFCGLNAGDPGFPHAETTTDGSGWYGLLADVGCDYYNILQTDPYGYVSNGATTVSGTVLSPNWVQYTDPLFDQVWTGNKFWDQLEENNGWLDGSVLDAYSGSAQPTCSP
ncbi:MAG: hypothetical protein JXA42_17450, partial [Anaerolineales bacterium]|nr:hypothetical protein [Anaerolineales bacterium]